MKYAAELFDKVQYLFKETGFNDHQLHCILQFSGHLDERLLKQALYLLLQAFPILACTYQQKGSRTYWQTCDVSLLKNLFRITEDQNTFESFSESMIDETIGPQIQACLYREKGNDSLSIIMNHMVCDGADFKRSLYVLSSFYTQFIKNPNFIPNIQPFENRSLKPVTSKLRLSTKIKSLLFNGKESNQKSEVTFPLATSGPTAPFILTHKLSEKRTKALINLGKRHGATVNDVVLTAYYRALSKLLHKNGSKLFIPIMIDMRRYAPQLKNQSLSNISSTIITHATIETNETFEETLEKINSELTAMKKKYMGVNGFVKLSVIDKIFPKKISYQIIKRNLHNPNICMTNIGILDDRQLVFGNTPLIDAFECGSIKYRPHFQIALSSFKGTMTFSCNLYGNEQDKQIIRQFFSLLDSELPG